MAYRPGKTHTDANRNLISNIHSRGLNPQAAADRILTFAAQMMALRISGFSIREQMPSAPSGRAIKA
jgi:ethanolamine ammonia-lyase small subunit